MKLLTIVNTHFQLLTIINLKLNKYQNDDIELMITDHVSGSESIIKKLKNTKIFSKIIYVPIEGRTSNHSILRKIQIFLALAGNQSIYLKTIGVKTDKHYDVILFDNIDLLSASLSVKLWKRNHDIKFVFFEEGCASYFKNKFTVKHNDPFYLYYFISGLLKRPNLYRDIECYWYYEKDLVLADINLKRVKTIPKLSKKDDKLIKLINYLYDYNNCDKLLEKKYIFFEESFFTDHENINDFELINTVIQEVGKDNLIIKRHPRNKINRFEKYNILTYDLVSIPWEVIQLNHNFEQQTFLTISSASVLASKLYFDETVCTFLLFNCIDKKPRIFKNGYLDYLNKLINKYGNKGMSIPKSINDLTLSLKNEDKYGVINNKEALY